jgi:hypothetical protein
MHFATHVQRSYVVHLHWYSHFVWAAASKMRTSNSSCVSTSLFQTSLFIQPHKQKSTALQLEIQTALLQLPFRIWQCPYELFFSQWPRLLPQKILIFPLKPPCTTDFMLSQLSVFSYIIKVAKYIFVHHVVSSQLTTHNFYCCTVHSEIHIVHSPTNALFINLERFKIYTRIHTNVAPTCFGLRPSSGSLCYAWLKLC